MAFSFVSCNDNLVFALNLFQEIEDSVSVKSLNKFQKMLLDLTDLENGKITNCARQFSLLFLNE